MKTVVIGFIGTILDNGFSAKRWERWRPTVAICQHDELLVDRMDIITKKRFDRLNMLIKDDIQAVSPETEVHFHYLDFDDPWDFETVYSVLHDFAKSYPFDTETNDYLLHITTGTHVMQICMYLLTESHYFPVKLMQTGPSYQDKHDIRGGYSVIDLDLSKYDQIAMRFQQQISDDISLLKSGIKTRNKSFNALMEKIEHVAMNSVEPILLSGPTGAGKSNLARRIYQLKQCRRQIEGEFIEINCATIRGDAAMSALFGHKRGAFTGALADREGLLKAANGGLLFLDEISELGADEQSMLLRAIEEKQFLPVGSDRETGSDFQLICGTNRNLHQEVQKGCFREDLLARINLWSFTMPGLRDRREDIEPNLDYELDRFAEKNKQCVVFNKEARARFLSFATSQEALWSSNFRDLSGAITRMCTLSIGGRITVDVVDEEITQLRKRWGKVEKSFDSVLLEVLLGEDYAHRFDRFQLVQLIDVLSVCRTSRNLSEAGRKLFAVSRKGKKQPNDADRLRKYLAKFGIEWRDLNTIAE